MAVAAPLYESGTLKHYEAIQTKYLDILKAVQHAEKSSKRKKKHIDELVSTDTWMWTALGIVLTKHLSGRSDLCVHWCTYGPRYA